MKLIKHIPIEGILHCISGTRVGAAKAGAGIGESDNPVLRDPISRLPYIPGSSLKGKIRSLCEWRERPTGRTACTCGQCRVCELFGSTSSRMPTLLIFRDAQLTAESADLLRQKLPDQFVEEKSEVTIGRDTGRVAGGGPRTVERVPPGTQFRFSVSMRVFQVEGISTRDKLTDYAKLLATAFRDLANDSLGGCGTRGYGEVTLLSPNGEKDLADILADLLVL